MPMTTKLLVRDVWKAYRTNEGTISVLEGIDLTVAAREFIAIVGPSGCGKSTFFNLLAGFEPLDAGEVLVDGQPIAGPGRQGIMITQRGSVFPWMTVRRNLEFGAQHMPTTERDGLIQYYLELCGLIGFEDAYPHQLSGGMLQRVEVARAFMAKPDILYMDEPFGALDALTRLQMRTELLRILNRDSHTCLLITHDVEEALHMADRVVVMSPRPAQIKRVLEIPVAHPRAMSHPVLLQLKEQILQELGLSVTGAECDTNGVPPIELMHRRPLRPRSGRARAYVSPAALSPEATAGAEQFDVVVVGGGPGGASAATILAERGLKVLVLERQHFPRFHTGESLLPALWELWDRLDVTAEIEAAGFVPKQGITFGMTHSGDEVALLTSEYPEYFPRTYAYHVERSRFDQILLDNARQKGAEVREGWSVQDVIFEADWARGVLAGPNDGELRHILADVVVDATGRDCLISRRLGWRRPDPALNKVAHFTYFAGAWRRSAQEFLPEQDSIAGAAVTDVHTVDGGWLCYIPLANDVVSVCVVLDAKAAGQIRGGPQERFDHAVASCPKVQEWLRGARPIMPMQTVSNIAYLNDRFVGHGFVLVGDAAMFIDPIFSSGVTLAIRGGIFAADCILDAFQQRDFSEASLKPYEERIRVPMDRIFRIIHNWYELLDREESSNMLLRAQRTPWLRERLIVLLSGGYEKMDLESFLLAASYPTG
jgi:FAD-dependent halogenase